MKVDVEIKASPEALNKGHRPRFGSRLFGQSAFLIRYVEIALLTTVRTSPITLGSLVNKNLS